MIFIKKVRLSLNFSDLLRNSSRFSPLANNFMFFSYFLTDSSLFKLKINSSLAIWHSFLHFSSDKSSVSNMAFLSNNKSLVFLILAFSFVNYLSVICKLYNSFDMSSIENLHSSLERSEMLVVNT